ncbi:ribosomal protein S6 kinase alpha-1/2/3/6 [Fistulifera solaris]|uniref:Ribosomal protein S6 kinase alpha-1/2/3/6 n=1 Tax=Fistulifera solaris TaxID=1519565 RepID=A0A1Z5JWT3_FISSO|nr:ribosomal protein S6 kinase alpha-1/2/3/6 [Fistulifera solaris]|eukprot:GAX18288.1 ribosomal protein S6 kinase alpha-1/2/3/6 [Fistulifera solaris]
MPEKEKDKDKEKKKKRKPSKPAIVLAGDEYDTQVAPSLNQNVKVFSELRAFERAYTRGPQLGLGAFAKVFMGTHKASGQEYAIKKIDRSKMVWGDRDALEDEINNLILVRDGPNIVQLYEVYEEKSHCFLVMGLLRGGELFDRILEQKTFTEPQARGCCRGLLTGLAYMHAKRVAHRDLKPENLLLMDHQNSISEDTIADQIKLADFGFAKKVKTENGCRTLCGTPGYLAPEILERFPAYDTKCDLWSVGVIIFLLLGGYLPFEDEDEDKVFEKTREGQYYFHPTYWKSISAEAKQFVTHLLTVNPRKRFSSEEALKATWMTSRRLDNDMSEHHEDGLHNTALQQNIKKGKQKGLAAVEAGDNRLAVLDEKFNGFLERTGADGNAARVKKDDGEKKPRQPKFVEDSAAGRPFSEFYDLGDILGEGGYACVYRAMHKRTKEIYAVKDIDTSMLESSSMNALQDEIAALKLLRGGPYIIRLFDVFQEPDHTFMVMEECRGGDLLTRVTEKEFYTEREARKTCKILFQAMDYIHKKKVAHRDIKPENVLMVEADDDHSIKIADFGFAKRVFKPNCLRTLCGTAQYVAPEVLDLHSPGYDHRADMWSVGVVVYILLGGYAPFEGPVHELAQVICKGEYCFHEKYWGEISNEAKDMISNLLQVYAEHRLSAEEALQCPWMAMEEEALTTKDLSGAKAVLQERQTQKAGDDQAYGIKQLDKHTSLDISFTAGLGTLEEVANRKTQITAQAQQGAMATIGEDGEEEGEEIYDSSSGRPCEELYTWGRVVEQGDFFTLREARHNQLNEIVSIKCVKRTDLESGDAVALQDEISTLSVLVDCEYIARLVDVFEEPDFTYVVMERLRGGELIDRLSEKKYYTENEARVVIKKLLCALEYCHNRRIANRNIKTETIQLIQKGSVTDVKLTDFGMAKRVLIPNGLQTQCGTEGYVAPEILEHRPEYDVQCDMWSLGVVMYMLLGGYRPFRGDGDEIIRKIRYGEYKFHKRYWNEISEEAKILISRMLTLEPIGRITATAALHSDWIAVLEDEEYLRQIEEEDRMFNRQNGHAKVRAATYVIMAARRLELLAGVR